MDAQDQPEQYVAYVTVSELKRYGVNLADARAGLVPGVGVDPLYNKGNKFKFQVTQAFLDSIDERLQDEADGILNLDGAA